MSKTKDSDRGDKLFEVQVEYSVSVLHIVPVRARDATHAMSRGTAIVKAGNTKKVGGRQGQEMWKYQIKNLRRLK